MERLAGAALAGLIGEVRSHPWTTITSAVALVVAGLALSTRAPADSLATLERSVISLKAATLESSIVEARSKQCEAVGAARDPDSFYARRVGELQREYRDIVGSYFNVPDCAEL